MAKAWRAVLEMRLVWFVTCKQCANEQRADLLPYDARNLARYETWHRTVRRVDNAELRVS
jgi:hypothetical protein